MSTRYAVITGRICDEVQRFHPTEAVADIVVDALLEAGVDLAEEPTLEEVKTMLVQAYRARRVASVERRQWAALS